jgi:hypothetical protein
VWLSPWLTFDSADVVATRLAALHPLLAINAVSQQFGFWTQSPHLYRLTALGQDVNFSLPTGTAACTLFFTLTAAIGLCGAWAIDRFRRVRANREPK